MTVDSMINQLRNAEEGFKTLKSYGPENVRRANAARRRDVSMAILALMKLKASMDGYDRAFSKALELLND